MADSTSSRTSTSSTSSTSSNSSNSSTSSDNNLNVDGDLSIRESRVNSLCGYSINAIGGSGGARSESLRNVNASALASIRIKIDTAKLYTGVWIKVIGAYGLTAADLDGKSDPYVAITCLGKDGKSIPGEKYYTPVIEDTLEPEWQTDNEFMFKPSTVAKATAIRFRCWDKDHIIDDFLGQSVVKLANDPDGDYDLPLKPRDNKDDKVSGGIIVQIKYQCAIHAAARAGHEKFVKVLLDDKINPNLNDNEGKTALFHAAHNGYLEVVKLLLRHGADVNARDHDGLTPLMEAATVGNVYMVKELIVVGSLVDDANAKGETALILASRAGNGEVVKHLLDVGKVKVDATDHHGDTALFHALNSHAKDVILRMLLESGAKVNVPNKAGKTALTYAQTCQHAHASELVALLKQYGGGEAEAEADAGTAAGKFGQ